MAKKRKAKDRRLAVVAFVLVLGLMGIAFKLTVLQGIQASKYRELAREQRDQSLVITPRRGTIFDREGEILAISEDVTTVYATPYQVEEPRVVAEKLCEVLVEDPDEIEEKLDSDSGFVYIARKLDNKRADKIKEMELEGIGFIDESKRFYPMGSLGAQVLGLVDVDNEGQAGLELYYQDILGGVPGEVLIERDGAGVPIPGSDKQRINAVDGTDIRLTLDRDIQGFAEEALESAVEEYSARAGTAIVMDCNTGDILAMASNPTFNPNERDNIDPSAMRNRAVTDVYEPGSSLKVLTASAALEEGIVEPDTIIHVPSQLRVADEVFTDAEKQPDRELSFLQVISQSSNVGTIKVAQMIGDESLGEYLSRFGLGHITGIDFPGEVSGIVPDVADWSGTSVATISIGQGISITPLQLACVVAAVANGGRRVYPHFMNAKITNEGVEDMGLGGVGEQVLSNQTCAEMAGIMMKVVAPEGTGQRAAVKYYSVAGKTGTAAKPVEGGVGYSKTYMATFVGFAPAENPRLVVLVVLDEPSPIWGGHTSAPVFSEIMGFSLQHLKVPPSWGPEPVVEGDERQ